MPSNITVTFVNVPAIIVTLTTPVFSMIIDSTDGLPERITLANTRCRYAGRAPDGRVMTPKSPGVLVEDNVADPASMISLIPFL